MGCGSACTEKETSPKVGKFAELEMWANTQRDGRPVKYRWRQSVQRRKVWLTPNTWLPCSNAAKTRNPLKLAGMPKLPDRSQPLVGRSSPYYQDTWRRYCCLTIFFPIVDKCLSCEDIARQSCTMVHRCRLFGDFLRPAFPASRLQHVSDLHPKFALRPHRMWKYGRHPISDHWDLARKGKKERRRTNDRMKIYMACPIT